MWIRRTALVSAAALAVGIGTPSLAGTWLLPGLANAAGRYGARFESEVFVLNGGTSEADVKLGLLPPSGTPPAQVVRTVKGGETLVLANALLDLWGLDGTFGTLTLESGANLVIAGATRNVASPVGTYGVGLVPVPAGKEIVAGTGGYAAWLSDTGEGSSGTRANVTVALLDSGSAATLEIRSASGALAGSFDLATDSPRTWQGTVREITSGAVDAGYAVLRVTAGRATGYVSVIDNATGDGVLSPFEAPLAGEPDVILNGVARTPGARGTHWTSSLRLLAPDAAVVVSLDVAGVSPPPPIWRVERTVPPGGLSVLEDLLAPFGAIDGSAGGLRLRASGPLVMAGVTATPDPSGTGRFGTSQGVVRHRGGMAGPGRTVTLVGLVHGGREPFRTNVALLAGGSGARATLTLRSRSGGVAGAIDVALGSWEWRQKSLGDWFSVTEALRGSRVDVSVTGGTLDAVATVIDDGTGDAVAREGAPLPAPCDGTVAGPAGGAATTLTLGAPSGTVRPLLGVNIGPVPAGQAAADLTGPYHEQGVTEIRTHDYYGPLDMATLYPNQAADPANPGSYNFAASDGVFAKILVGSFEPFLRLGDSYSAQLPYPQPSPRRPTNPDNWVKATVEVVRHYDDAARWAGRPLKYVEIWNEPDNGRFWDGSPQQFFDLFTAAARAIKQAFPHLRIGGPGFAPSGALAPQGQAMARGLIEQIARTATPVDFLSWHVYSNDPEQYRTVARFYRNELDRNGLTALPSVITEWNTDTKSVSSTEALPLRTGGRGASVLSAAQIVLQEEGVVGSQLYRGPDPSATAPEFYGIFYADGRPKRSALALGLWKRLADHPDRLALTSQTASGPPLYAFAGRDDAGEVALLIANPSSTPSSVRLVRGDGGPVSCLRVEELGDGSESVTSRAVSGETVSIGGYTTLLVTLRP